MPHSQCRGPRVQFLVRELDPHIPPRKILHAATKTHCSKRKEGKKEKGRREREKRGKKEGRKWGTEKRSHIVWEVRISYNYC